MTGLESILRYILDEKTNKIIPENIKKDVTILGVTGIVESGTDTDTATIYPTLGVQDNREGDINIGDLVDIIIDASAENVKKGDYGQILSCTSNGTSFGSALSIGYEMYECVVEVINVQENIATVKILSKILRQASSLGGDNDYTGALSLIMRDNYLTLFNGIQDIVKEDTIYPANYSGMMISIKFSDIAEAIGLTADKIKQGETILGITGTYTGEETPPEEEVE